MQRLEGTARIEVDWYNDVSKHSNIHLFYLSLYILISIHSK